MSKLRLAISLALVLTFLIAQSIVITERGSFRWSDFVLIVCVTAIGALRVRNYLRTRASSKSREDGRK